MYEKNIDDRFWGKVDKKGPDNCWDWTASFANSGYGRFNYSATEYYAHRVAWILTNKQPIPKGMWILHKCNNKKCCNPNHIYMGTPADNERDARESGITYYRRKCTEEEVRQIKDLRNIFTLDEIAKMYDVSIFAIWKYCKT